MRRISMVASGALAALFMIGASGAQAATVTVGSPLTAPLAGTFGSSPSGTWANTVLSESGANPVSPVTGTIVHWRMTGAYSGGPFKLRVLRPTSMGSYTAVSTSTPVTPLGNGLQTFTTASLSVQAGDLIGVDITTGTNVAVGTMSGSHPVNWNPALADGAGRPPDYTNYPNAEILFNADVDYTPPSPPTTAKKKCKKKKKKHSAAAAKKKHCKKKKKK
jgi:hypothetical protein